MPRFVLLLSFLLISLTDYAQLPNEERLTAGPMQGHTTATTTSLWIMVANTDSVRVTLKDTISGAIFSMTQSTQNIIGYKKDIPITFNFTGLKPNTSYIVYFKIDDKELRRKHYIRTLLDGKNNDFSFMIGSCALWISRGLRWLHPGIEEWIYPQMVKEEGAFMLWLGDYLYNFPKDYKSPEGMYRRYAYTRKYHKLHMDFVTSRPQYSIWDDHEFGWNNSDKDFPFKKQSLDLHKKFWANPGYGEPDNPGCYFNFSYQDAGFFMTDCRYYRTVPNIKGGEMLGKKQMQWLKAKLKESKATFKFIGVGSQVLNEYCTDESWKIFPEERTELLDFIEKEKITGVIFLSGDRHHGELIKKVRENAYPLYDFTSSAITSFRHKVKRTPEENNPDRVPNTLIEHQNYGRIGLSGPEGKRDCTFYSYNCWGKLVWEVKISENDLKFFEK